MNVKAAIQLIEAMCERSRQLESQVEERDLELAEKELDLADKDMELDEKNALIARQAQVIEDQRGELAERDRREREIMRYQQPLPCKICGCMDGPVCRQCQNERDWA